MFMATAQLKRQNGRLRTVTGNHQNHWCPDILQTMQVKDTPTISKVVMPTNTI